MSTGWSFRPPPWAVAGLMLGCALTIYLGIWQLQRGRSREAMDAQYAAAVADAPFALASDAPTPQDAMALSATAEGVYLNRQLLLDNQVRDRVPGYQVLTPLRLATGGLVIVNRGWLPQNPDRRVLPSLPLSAESLKAKGLWRALPQPALHLQTHNCDAGTASWPRIVEYPSPEDLTCIYREPVAPGMLLLAPEASHGFVREWTLANSRFPPSRHYGYAAQWFAFAATLFVLFVKLNLKRRI